MTVRLDGIDLVVFDKDGTIIEFGSMWSGWAVALVEGLVDGHGTADRRAPLRDARVRPRDRDACVPGGGLAATPMARLRDRTREVLVASGLTAADAERALEAAWHAPDPVASARPVTDLAPCSTDCATAAAGSPWRRPTTATRPNGPWPPWAWPTASTRRSVPMTASRSSPRRTWSSTCARRSGSSRHGPRWSATRPPTCGWGARPAPGWSSRVLTGVGGRADLEPLADAVIASVEELEVGAAS